MYHFELLLSTGEYVLKSTEQPVNFASALREQEFLSFADGSTLRTAAIMSAAPLTEEQYEHALAEEEAERGNPYAGMAGDDELPAVRALREAFDAVGRSTPGAATVPFVLVPPQAAAAPAVPQAVPPGPAPFTVAPAAPLAPQPGAAPPQPPAST